VPNPTSDLLLLRMEIKAIRDRVVLDLDAALAKIDAALPEEEDTGAKPRTAAEWKVVYGKHKGKRREQ
jgi:hypothetical protein